MNEQMKLDFAEVEERKDKLISFIGNLGEPDKDQLLEDTIQTRFCFLTSPIERNHYIDEVLANLKQQLPQMSDQLDAI